MNEQKDIFDKMMRLPGLNVFEPFYKRYKEVLLYLFFGVLTTVISFVTFWFFSYVVPWNELVANLISWVAAVLFAYVTNRIWVFHSTVRGFSMIMKEMTAFLSGRFLTLLFEDAVLLIFVTLMHQNRMLIKFVATIGVMILNYVISKLVVFRKKKTVD